MLPARTVLADRRNMAYSGTLVTAGTARRRGGNGSRDGDRADPSARRQAEGVSTPLTRRLAEFSRWLTVVIMALAASRW